MLSMQELLRESAFELANSVQFLKPGETCNRAVRVDGLEFILSLSRQVRTLTPSLPKSVEHSDAEDTVPSRNTFNVSTSI